MVIQWDSLCILAEMRLSVLPPLDASKPPFCFKFLKKKKKKNWNLGFWNLLSVYVRIVLFYGFNCLLGMYLKHRIQILFSVFACEGLYGEVFQSNNVVIM